MKSSTPELLKFRKLQFRLGESRRGVVGLLELLWLATAKNCPQGDIGRFPNEEIALLVDWEGNPDELIEALIECRWLDEDNEHRLVVHDWQDHCPNYVKGNIAKYNKRFVADRPREHPREHPRDSPCDAPTKPSQAKSSQTKPPPPTPAVTDLVENMSAIDWEVVEEFLVRFGVDQPRQCLNAAKQTGSTPDRVADILTEYQRLLADVPNRWNDPPAVLYTRIKTDDPRLDVSRCWPKADKAAIAKAHEEKRRKKSELAKQSDRKQDCESQQKERARNARYGPQWKALPKTDQMRVAKALLDESTLKLVLKTEALLREHVFSEADARQIDQLGDLLKIDS